MKNLNKAVQCLLSFGNASNFKELKKLYKKAALLAHSDRKSDGVCDYSMVDINQAWECISRDPEGALRLIECSEVLERIRAHADSWMNDPLHEATVPSFYSVETMAKKAWEIVEESRETEFEWFHSRRTTVYIKDANLEYTHYYGSDSLSMYDLENAFKTGKSCPGFRVLLDRFGHGEFWSVWHLAVRDNCDASTPESVWKWLDSLHFEDQGRYLGTCAFVEVDGARLKVYRDEEKGAKQFSPFVLDWVKPVSGIPKKWTVVHLRKILANGQFRSYTQDYYYTDDFAMDSAMNYRQGYISNPMKSFADVLTCSSMRVWANTNSDGVVTLHFGAHSNDGRSLIVELNNRYPKVDMELEEKQYLKGAINLLDVA